MKDPRHRPRWRTSVGLAAAALWAPFVATLAFNHQVRRVWEDLWFWPGLLPGKYAFDHLYDDRFAYFAVLNLAGWTLVCRRWPVGGVLGALVHSTLSAIYLCLLAAM